MPPSRHRDLAVHQQGQEPVAELGEVLVFLLKHILSSEDGRDHVRELLNDIRFSSSFSIYLKPVT